MKLSTYLHTSLLAAAANAVTIMSPAVEADYDAIVVGGGPAGLAATSGLARVRRNVLMIDSGEYRNDPTRHAHDIPGFDGVTPAWLRYAARKQIKEYGTANLVNGTVTKIEPQNNNTSFNVSVTYPGDKKISFITRKVVLGTGMKDNLPATPGVAENWGKGIYWCPWCDGHEHADQELAIVGALDQGATTAREVLTLNEDIVLLVNGTDTPERRATTDQKFPGWEKYLELHNIKVENRSISSIERLRNGTDGSEDPSQPTHPEHDLFQVNFDGGGEPLLRNAFLTNFGEEQKSKLGEETGVMLHGTKLAADNSKGLATNIPGIFAIGDCNSDNVTNVPHAFFSGKRTAVFLHVALERENSVAQLARYGNTKREAEAELRSIWERMNPADDVLHAGDFDQ